jgi:hypothetical protein
MRKLYTRLGLCALVVGKLACTNGGSGAGSRAAEGDSAHKEASAPSARLPEGDSSHKDAMPPAAADEKNAAYPIDNISAFEGIVQISDTAHYSDGFDFTVYNKDLTVWKKLRFSPEMADSADMMPYMFNYDHNLMIYRCLQRKGDYYLVIVNEKQGLQKLISVHEKFLMFQNWPQHLASAYAVEFDAKKNPLRKDADSLAAKIAFDKEQTYRPDKITGDWLRVKWGGESSPKRGWIKWKDIAGNLMVNIFYEE